MKATTTPPRAYPPAGPSRMRPRTPDEPGRPRIAEPADATVRGGAR